MHPHDKFLVELARERLQTQKNADLWAAAVKADLQAQLAAADAKFYAARKRALLKEIK